MGLIEKLQAKLELFRLEQRYTRNRHRRSTFISNAVYKDGEYIYQTPNTTGSSTNSAYPSQPSSPSPWSPGAVIEEEQESGGDVSSSSNNSARNNRRSLEEPRSRSPMPEPQTTAERKKMNRWSSMPGFGSTSSWKGNRGSAREWRSNTVEVTEVR